MIGDNAGFEIEGKKKRCRVRVSADDWLDMILPFFTRRKLFQLKLTDRLLKHLIESGTEKGQLRQKSVFHQIHFMVVFTKYIHNLF
jgi:hypothetical protein